jgi:hypothetical protein|eukprot:COSAG01_NODE_60814_length_292_cov_1.880829_1_plen_78_part_10
MRSVRRRGVALAWSARAHTRSCTHPRAKTAMGLAQLLAVLPALSPTYHSSIATSPPLPALSELVYNNGALGAQNRTAS